VEAFLTAAEFWLSRNLKEAFGLPNDAHDWLMGLWNVAQVFDDMADGDFPERDQLDRALCDALVLLPENQFYAANKHILLPLVALCILKWKASDDLERAGEAGAMSYVWRAGFYDLVLACVQIAHGMETAMEIAANVARLYGESLEDYVKEMRDA
jgi:hypothetical protein